MQMHITGQVMGVKRFSGLIDGKSFDYCRVIVSTPLDESQGNALGSSASEYDFGNSSNFERFKGFQFPFDSDLTVELVASGKGQKLKIIDFKPKIQVKA